MLLQLLLLVESEILMLQQRTSLPNQFVFFIQLTVLVTDPLVFT
jgi:hypothetical protein